MVLPVGNLNKVPQLVATNSKGGVVGDLVFLGNFCDRNVATQTFTLADPGGAHVGFTVSSSSPGVTLSPSSGTTPASAHHRAWWTRMCLRPQQGTTTVTVGFASSAAVNVPTPVRVLINSRQPDQRGTSVNIGGTLVDLMADTIRNQYYVLRQDLNQVLIFNGANNTQTATLRTCTKPMSMAITLDNNSLLVGCDNAHIMSVFDLNSLQAMPSIDTASGYVQSLAVSNKSILAVMRDGGGGPPYIARIDTTVRTSSKPASLGVFKNEIALNSVLVASSNGSRIFMASSDGSTMLYDANADTFTISRKDFTSLSGAFAASPFDQFVVGDFMLNSSLVQTAQFESSTGSSSGFTFMSNASGVRTTTPNAASPGIIQHVNLASGAEHPAHPHGGIAFLLGLAPAARSGDGTSCVTNTTSSGSTQTCINGSVVTTIVCSTTTSAHGPTQQRLQHHHQHDYHCGRKRIHQVVGGSAEPDGVHQLIDLGDHGASRSTMTPPVALPQINAVVSAADNKVCSGSWRIDLRFTATQLSPTNLPGHQ